MKTRILLAVAFLVLGACTTIGPQQISKTQSTPDYRYEAERAMKEFDSTGMVVAVSVGGETTYLNAFGKVEEGTDRPVTEDMLFPIASISKAFTTTALAILVDRGQVEWDAPMRTYIPEFAMYDPWVSENFTVRDALTHRSGLPLGAGDLLFWPDADPSIDDILTALPHLKPEAGFRAAYAYDNLLYVVAGEIVPRVTGKSWQDFVTQEIMDPVGLTNCAADGTRIKPGQSVVTGHERAAGAEEGTPVDERTQFAPSTAAAGGLFCPAGDMMKWANFWLDGAVTADGKRLVTEKQAKELWTGVTPKRTSGVLRKAGHTINTLYALGWNVQDFEGTRMISHSGGAPGVVSNFILLPEKDIAIFASANDYRSAPTVFAYQIADGLLGGQDFDFVAESGTRFAKAIQSAQAELSDAYSPPSDAKAPTLPLSDYVGTYRDPWYGDVSISKTDAGLFIDMSRSEILDGPLNAYNEDRFVAVWPDRSLKADAFVDFSVEGGKVMSMKIKAVSDITDFSFDFHDLNLTKID
jgi:CubicO group peptidase (beta-lactamase class C family)